MGRDALFEYVKEIQIILEDIILMYLKKQIITDDKCYFLFVKLVEFYKKHHRNRYFELYNKILKQNSMEGMFDG